MADWKPGAVVIYKNVPKYVSGVLHTRLTAKVPGASYVKLGNKTFILVDFPASVPLGTSALKTT